MNLPSVMILDGAVKVEFVKIMGYELSKALRLYLAISSKIDQSSSEKIIAGFLGAEQYETFRDILFAGCNVEQVGLINSKMQFEKLCDTHGLLCEIELFDKAVDHFLGDTLKKNIEKGNIKAAGM